MPDFYL